MKRKPYKIKLSNEAEADFDNAYNFYAEENDKRADNFYKQTNKSLEVIAENPRGFQKTLKNIRRYVMK
jgi:plasmid stabilization system protein ParE